MRKLGPNSDLIDFSMEHRSNKLAKKLKIPIGCAGGLALCGALVEMVRVMDFTAIQLYVNAFLKLFTK